MAPFRLAFSTSALGLWVHAAFPQTVSITPWKDNAKAAYTMTLDDYCENIARGIHEHADTLFHNRRMAMGFATIVGSCTEENHWKIAARMISHGHEFLNHSWSHTCGRKEEWCSAPYWDSAQFHLEIDSSTRAAENKLGVKVRFFVFPFDLWEDSKLLYLKSKGYLGARSGFVKDVNPPDFQNPFDLAFDALQPPQNAHLQIFGLDAFVDRALETGGWALRETHGVADESWGSMTVDQFRNHLDYVKSKVDSGLLWVSGPSAVLLYQKQRMAYKPVMAVGEKLLIVHWDKPNLDTSVYNVELSFRIQIPPGFPPGFSVYQNLKPLPHQVVDASTLQVNARPHLGFLHVTKDATNIRAAKSTRRKYLHAAQKPGRIEVQYRLAAGPYRLELITLQGMAKVLAEGALPPGFYSLPLPRNNFEPGLYLLQLTQDGRREFVSLPVFP